MNLQVHFISREMLSNFEECYASGLYLTSLKRGYLLGLLIKEFRSLTSLATKLDLLESKYKYNVHNVPCM